MNVLDDIDIIIYDFVRADSTIEEHSILLFTYEDFITYQSFNNNFIVIYDKNQKAIKEIGEVANEDWNLYKEVSEYDYTKTRDEIASEIEKLILEIEYKLEDKEEADTNYSLIYLNQRLDYIEGRKPKENTIIKSIQDKIVELDNKVENFKLQNTINSSLIQELENKYLDKPKQELNTDFTNENYTLQYKKWEEELTSLQEELQQKKIHLEAQKKTKILESLKLEYYKYALNLNDLKPILNFDDTLSSLKKKLHNLYELGMITEEQLFFLKNDSDSSRFVFNIEVEEQFNLIKNRLHKLRQESHFIESISDRQSSKEYFGLFKDLINVSKRDIFREKFEKLIRDIYDKKIMTIIDKRKKRELYRLLILNNIFDLKLIELYELFYFYKLDKDLVTTNFRQKQFTKESIQIILRYVKYLKADNIDTQIYDTAYAKKIKSLQLNKVISKKELEFLIYQDFQLIVNPINKQFIIEELTLINKNEKRSRGIYTKLLREFIFSNLYRLEYNYGNDYVDYKIKNLNLFNQKERKRELVKMTSCQIRYDLYEYVEDMIIELEELVEDEKESLIFQFDGILCIENFDDAPPNTKCFGFVKKLPKIGEHTTTEELLSIMKRINTENIRSFFEYSEPYIVN
ncbi:MAG: hypothetical protein KKB94_11885 [Proteobacteria bacterium]|nr:hypothetical protein [Pseudomonadota bacterium]